jgi:hypothetical protein
VTRRNSPSRKSLPAPSTLATLEAELHAQYAAAAPFAPFAAALIDFVTAHPGTTVAQAITGGSPSLARHSASALVRELVASGRLRADPPGVPFHGRLRLYAPDGTEP